MCLIARFTDEEEKRAFEEEFLTGYNTRVVGVCDPFFRYLTKVDIVRVESLQDGEDYYTTIELALVGKCYSCN
jgi:hypothetical protein